MYILQSDSCLYWYAQDWINESGGIEEICVSNTCYRSNSCTVSSGTGVTMINKERSSST